jgi:hypothetical protein
MALVDFMPVVASGLPYLWAKENVVKNALLTIVFLTAVLAAQDKPSTMKQKLQNRKHPI